MFCFNLYNYLTACLFQKKIGAKAANHNPFQTPQSRSFVHCVQSLFDHLIVVLPSDNYFQFIIFFLNVYITTIRCALVLCTQALGSISCFKCDLCFYQHYCLCFLATKIVSPTSTNLQYKFKNKCYYKFKNKSHTCIPAV